jgi:phytoene dehydrogenase-like protein
MSTRAPIVVIGGGHNGLTAAALLARAGRRVVLCEASESLGGIAARGEFHPGYFHPGLWHETCRVRPSVVRELSLEGHGFSLVRDEVPVHVPQVEGPGLTLRRDPEAAHAEINVHSARDARAYKEWREGLSVFRAALEQVLENPPADPNTSRPSGLLEVVKSGLSLRLLGSKNLIELTRILPMCSADWLSEHFETELLKSALAAPALLGNWCGPWSPGTTTLNLLHECSTVRDVHGGPAALIGCLERAARHHGAELRVAARVERIETERGHVRAVILETGETLAASAVLCACDPKTALLDLLDPRVLPIGTTQRIENFRTRGTTAKLHLALDALPRFLGRPDATFEHASTGETLDDLERAFDPVKYGELPKNPHLDLRFPSLSDAELAPPGKHVASILVHFVPRELEGGWSDSKRDELQGIVLAKLRTFLPDLDRLVVACETLTPADLEERHGLPGGHVFHGEHALDQLHFMRPEPDCARHATPIDGLFLASSGSHPGGGITCGPGALAARAALTGAR